ncbi:TetR family transcriptional regulator [Luteibacter rhizovicinus]|uniref:TetR family transcriptional regulator n=1 Tax=Luteibacter rhizovicinus TaxID=242606 RepID=UPI001B80AEF0|nr:TetR family transcriptional regulator [Luteibacter rhizovicinus]
MPHILEREGSAGYTTNAVAERAGVSIGSLYQRAVVDAAGQRGDTDAQALETRVMKAVSGYLGG